MRACGCYCEDHAPTPDLEMGRYGTEEAFIVHMPERRSGAPTIGHSRIDTEMVADLYWQGGLDDLRSGYDLTVGQIVTAVWFEARYGSRTRRKRWADWLEANEMNLWSPSYYGHPEMPPVKDSA